MRYYAIRITDPSGNLITTPSSVPGSGFTYTSFAGNKSLPNALQVDFDIPLAPYATPLGGAIVRIWGVSLQEISQAVQLNPKFTAGSDAPVGFDIAIYGGMQSGLPLANPKQAGLLVQGSILQAFSNWIGTDMNLDLIVAPSFGTAAAPKNIVFNWKAGTPLSEALATTLSTAFPGVKQNIRISPNVVVNNDEVGFYPTLEQFAMYVKQVSISVVGGSYQGVDIFLSNGVFEVFDHTTDVTPKQIAFQDLIGQPTWIEDTTIQFKCAMRGDIAVGTYIRMPPAIVTTTAAAPTALVNLKSTFAGSFFISLVRHVGSFRQPDAASWVSVFNATAPPVSA